MEYHQAPRRQHTYLDLFVDLTVMADFWLFAWAIVHRPDLFDVGSVLWVSMGACLYCKRGALWTLAGLVLAGATMAVAFVASGYNVWLAVGLTAWGVLACGLLLLDDLAAQKTASSHEA